MKRHLLAILLPALIVLLSTTPTFAQLGANTCSPYIQDALRQLDDACAGIGRNTACYGHTLVQAELQIDAIDDFTNVRFAAPSDTLQLPFVASLRTAPLNLAEDVWGIAIMNAQANLPGTLPGQGVVMLVMGDTEIASAVSPDETLVVNTPPVRAEVNTQGARIRSGPGTDFSVSEVARAGDLIDVDARSEAGDWLRVVYGQTGGWIFRDLVIIDRGELAALPTLDGTLQTAMQTFFFNTGIGSADCQEAPDALLIQSPRGVSATMNINESEITLSSTILLETDANQMVLYVLDGEARVNNLIIPEGYKAFVNTTSVQTQPFPTVSGQWRSCDPLNRADRERLSELPNVPANILNYPVQLPGQPTRYCASPEELATLRQQAAATDVPTAAPTAEPGITPSPTQLVGYDCSTFRLASPREGMAFGDQTFYWQPPNPGAASYDVFVYDNGGNLVAQGSTSNAQITLDTGAGNPGGGAYYSWTVQARDANGNIVCGPLDPAVQLREAAPIIEPELEGTDEPCFYDDC